MVSAVQNMESQRTTELTAFFEYNRQEPDTDVAYVDFPEYFTWNDKQWKPRKRGPSDTIGRVHVVNPAAGDVYYLRMLLHHDHSKGKKSFEDLRTVDEYILESYQEVCRALGLLQDDREWDEALAEGSSTFMPAALRELYVTILMFCMPSNPKELFENHHLEWADDFEREALKKGLHLSDSQKRTLVLLDIQQRLHSWERNLKQIGIAEPTDQELNEIAFTTEKTLPILFKEELDFKIEDMEKLVEDRKQKFTKEQREVFDSIMRYVENKEAAAFFVDARGGTGKTFVLNAILAAVRVLENGSIALAVGATGIAANLLHLGRTLHSRFKVPLNINQESVCNITANSTLAKLICETKIIVWDEAPMSHRYQLEALDRTLRDVTGVDEPFGGKIMLLSGDFRQCLPVIPNSSRAEVVDAALNRSYLWQFFKVMKLSENMRVKLSNYYVY
jgi:hypothetical protein